MKVYISGKVTGLKREEAWMNFQTAEDRLTEEGYEVVNPLKNGLDFDESWQDHMREDVKLLMECDAIHMMNNWEDSGGATLERLLAEMIGLRFII